MSVCNIQEFSNVWASQIFECKVLLSILNSRKIFEGNILSSDSVAESVTQKRGFSVTDVITATLLLTGFPVKLIDTTIKSHF